MWPHSSSPTPPPPVPPPILHNLQQPWRWFAPLWKVYGQTGACTSAHRPPGSFPSDTPQSVFGKTQTLHIRNYRRDFFSPALNGPNDLFPNISFLPLKCFLFYFFLLPTAERKNMSEALKLWSSRVVTSCSSSEGSVCLMYASCPPGRQERVGGWGDGERGGGGIYSRWLTHDVCGLFSAQARNSGRESADWDTSMCLPRWIFNGKLSFF